MMKQFSLAEKTQILSSLFEGTQKKYHLISEKEDQKEISSLEEEIKNL